MSVLASSRETKNLKPFQLSGQALGPSVSLLVLHEDAGVAQAALADALAEVQGVDEVMSLYRDDSQLVALNRHGELSTPDARLIEVLRYSQELAERTSGAFDVTVQPLWEFVFAGEGRAAACPAEEALAAARTEWAGAGWRRRRT